MGERKGCYGEIGLEQPGFRKEQKIGTVVVAYVYKVIRNTFKALAVPCQEFNALIYIFRLIMVRAE